MDDWKAELKHLLTENDVRKVDPAAIREIVLSKLPVSIYKYRAVNAHSLDNLRTGTVWVSSPEDLNDPFDTSQKLDSEKLYIRILRRFALKDMGWKPIRNLIGEQEFRNSLQTENPIRVITQKGISKVTSVKGPEASSWVSAVISAYKKELRRLSDWSNDAFRSGIKIGSFSEICNSTPMWSHYADEHRGFCIEWKLDSLPNDSPLLGSLYPMLYGEDRFDMTKHIEMSIKSRYPNPFIAIAAALYKSSSWKHEKEWRIVLPLGFGVKSYNYRMPVPSSVLLGARVSKDSEKEIVQAAGIAGISVKRVRLGDTGYTLEVDPYPAF